MDDAQGGAPRRGLVAAEKAGRGGDRVLGHLTPGELVVPKSCQTPELMGLFARVAHAAGLDPNRFIVGSPEASKNPRTGLEEFDDGDGDGDGSGPSGEGGPGDTEGGGPGPNSNGAGPMGGENAATGSAYGSTADRDAAYGGGWSDGNGDGIGGWLSSKFDQAFAAPTGKSLGVLGTGIGMIGGPVGMAMAAGPAVAETVGNAITGGIQDAFGVTADSPPGTVDYGQSNVGMGGSSRTDARDIAPDIRKRRGLLTRRTS